MTDPGTQPTPQPAAAPLPKPPPAVASSERARARRLASRPKRFSALLFLAVLAGQVLAGSILVGGIIFLAGGGGLSPERALAVAGGGAALVALGSSFLAAALARKVGFWEVTVSGVLFVVGATLYLGRLLSAPFGLVAPSLMDVAYLARLLSENPFGAVGLAAALLWAATLIGASLGFLLAGSGRLDFGFSYELFVARSHLRLRKKSPTMIMTVISIGGVTVGVLALTVVLSVMSGFELDLKAKIIGTNAHAVVLKYGQEFRDWKDVGERVRKVDGVTGVTPFILNEVMISSDQNLAGSLIKGIDPATVSQVTNLVANMQQGRLDWLERPERIRPPPTRFDPAARPGEGAGGEEGERGPRGAVEGDGAEGSDARGEAEPGLRGAAEGEGAEGLGAGGSDARGEAERGQGGAPEGEGAEGRGAAGRDARGEGVAPTLPGIVLGKELAHSLKVMVGDRVNVVSPLGGELGPTGPMPKSRPFRVAGIFFSGMYEYDAKFTYIALPEAQRFFNLGDSVTGLELKTADIDDTRRITRAVLNELDGYPYRTKDWGEMNKNLFSALRLEKLVMAVILAFIVLVACFNIVSTLIMMVLEKSKEVAILKSMGATDTSVMKIFVSEGLIIGVLGTACGLVLGYLACLFVEVIGIRLDAEVYYIDKLPVKIDPLQFAAVALLAVLLSYLATIYPATRASRLPPVDGLRNE